MNHDNGVDKLHEVRADPAGFDGFPHSAFLANFLEQSPAHVHDGMQEAVVIRRPEPLVRRLTCQREVATAWCRRRLCQVRKQAHGQSTDRKPRLGTLWLRGCPATDSAKGIGKPTSGLAWPSTN